jgi:hypothetical protein
MQLRRWHPHDLLTPVVVSFLPLDYNFVRISDLFLPALRASCISSYIVWSQIISVRARKLRSLSLCTLLRPVITSSIIVPNIPRLTV